MLIVPAVDIRRGECVQLVGGKPDTGKKYGDPIQTALDWEQKGASCLHIVDLDAAMNEGENLGIIEKILNNLSINVQVGGGIRTVDKGVKILNLGADRIILGTAAFEKPNVLKELIKKTSSEKIMVSLDVKKGKITIKGWKKETEGDLIDMAKKFEEMGVGGFLFTNIDAEGKMSGLDTKYVEKLVSDLKSPVFAAGGVKSLEDVKKARETGVAGLVIGTALYEKKISFKKAMEVIKNEKSQI
ncbi:1-(5-phosphoribosyl)-5-[(5-phosphoribosylamino)methylideneamino] imidazole-4-carboxamide isomerase [candidate division MSBL1 archaeon SCGC-AAA382A13]|uniref:1-(5-phosphoribosyl)-5-[(5-phosphoribosylamino)methylideneamino] imidazole-4-carboxamide isomerase n=2 Tax=candidate division MSBL1 TaxID=215777 RepID=A0A133VH20_9EURY|nr:1-(5-phosphoribosyl)-5-[(5-phosphoribosylamino)methylideneamino] imidazole-4-carboxamide isomerase [candidate division MSBL1 archaeon SCGC-AAA382A13]KXB05704.1 1-(5-phosphoribosyl)-5-[(5-phosphoribosylamino)methylideneamino] imidazole-4-carboxamide isomerase [candidate division MSBL1 archaeon SCGC-AAA382A03]